MASTSTTGLPFGPSLSTTSIFKKSSFTACSIFVNIIFCVRTKYGNQSVSQFTYCTMHTHSHTHTLSVHIRLDVQMDKCDLIIIIIIVKYNFCSSSHLIYPHSSGCCCCCSRIRWHHTVVDQYKCPTNGTTE